MVKILVREYSIEYCVQKANAQQCETATLEKQINILDKALEKHCCKFERRPLPQPISPVNICNIILLHVYELHIYSKYEM